SLPPAGNPRRSGGSGADGATSRGRCGGPAGGRGGAGGRARQLRERAARGNGGKHLPLPGRARGLIGGTAPSPSAPAVGSRRPASVTTYSPSRRSHRAFTRFAGWLALAALACLAAPVPSLGSQAARTCVPRTLNNSAVLG